MIRFFLAAGLATQLFGVTLEEIAAKPSSHAKNFLIWQFFDQKITPKEAEEAFYQIAGVTINDLHRYAQKGNDASIRYVSNCLTTAPEKIIALKQPDCRALALTPSKFSRLEPAAREALINTETDPKRVRWMHAMRGKKVANLIDPQTLMFLFVRAGAEYRDANFNRPYSPKEISNLATQEGFSTFVLQGVMNPNLSRMASSLLHVEMLDALDAQTHFYLGLNALRFDRKPLALEHFDAAYVKANYQQDKDKALFWRYQVTHDPALLARLDESFDINLYTLYARELLGKKRGNYYTSLHVNQTEAAEDITDPFVWNAILDEIRATPTERLEALSKRYGAPSLMGVQSFIVERATRYRNQGFLTPYREHLSHLNLDTQAMIYALMRQESRFIPSALSSSYAMGLMQLMPFLVRDMAKKRKEPLEKLEVMFDPIVNLDYASQHLAWLKQTYYHPLFIAYSYNGGYGFLRNHLQEGKFDKGAYEPFMSMEMMLNSESREYGKKVLANYVIYKEMFGESVSIRDLCDSLSEPSRTDRFRVINQASSSAGGQT